MGHVESYTYLALARLWSWTLDQNALAYATEQLIAREGPNAITDLGAERNVFVQVPARTLYENGQRRLERRLQRQRS